MKLFACIYKKKNTRDSRRAGKRRPKNVGRGRSWGGRKEGGRDSEGVGKKKGGDAMIERIFFFFESILYFLMFYI